jgi:hypothetical protein
MRQFQQAVSGASVRHWLVFSTVVVAVLVGVGVAAGATGPAATIDSQPSSLSNLTKATFSFSTTEQGSGFACSLDGAEFAPCTSPAAYDGSLADGAHEFQVQALDALGNSGPVAGASWSIDTVAPDTTVETGPATTDAATATFGFSSTEAGSSFQCSLDGAAYSACPSPQSYTGLLEGNHTLRAKAIDAAGNADAIPASWAWTVAATPTVTAKTLDGANGVSVLARPSATFSRAIDPMTLNTATFKLTSSAGSAVAASVAYDPLSKTATLVPSTELAASTSYRAELTTAVEAEGDLTPLASAVAWTFTTTAAPEVKTSSIAPGATGVSPYAGLVLTFTRTMDPLSFTTASLSLWRPDGTQVTALPSYDTATNTAILTPIFPLNYSTTYTIKLSGLRAANGLAIVPISWRFTITGTMISKRINAGSATAYKAIDGDVWEADQSYRNGVAESFPDRTISGTSDPSLFRDHRRASSSYAPWVYNIPIPNGAYRVNLYFVELTKSACRQRVFSLDIVDTLSVYPDVYNLDIFREVGANAVDVKSFDVTITDGTLSMRSIVSIDVPEIAAIEIVPKQ